MARFLKGLGILALITAVAVAITGWAVYASMARQLPDPDAAAGKGRDQSTVIMDRNGKLLAKVFAEQNRQDVALDKIPTELKQAVIATEDKRFYEHEGVDPIGIARALVTDVIKGERAQGGSTITQQYVKQAFVTSEKTLKRKVQEAILAQRIEKRYTKDEILELYLNTIYFGHGAYGVEAASRAYFNKSVRNLTLAESALIAGVLKSPGNYSPYLEPENAVRRRNTVLKLMLAQGYIDEAAYTEASESEIKVAGLRKSSGAAPYFVEWIKEQLVEKYGETAVYRGGLRVTTTLDIKAQKAAEKAVADILDKKGDPSAAIVSIKPGTGEVIAMVGGRDFKKQQFNVAVQGKRQPGSAFKPFVLATALDGDVWSEKAYESGPAKLPVGSQTWSVTGASGGRKGPLRLRPATEQSVNSVYAQLILEVGAEKVVEMAEKLGIVNEIEPVPAIALGGLERGVSPLEMANAYATLAANGTRATPYGISEVRTYDGSISDKTEVETEEAIDPKVAFITTDILKGVISRGTGKGADIGRPAAGKTGTTQEYRDAWFVGYTPDLATAVWVGYPDSQREMKSIHGRAVTGGSFPAEIWAAFMKAALKGVDEHRFTRPGGIKSVEVCDVSGGLPTEFCPKKVKALVIPGVTIDTCTEHTTPTEVKVPNVVGMSKVDALAALEKLDLVVKVVEQPIVGVAPGTVASQNPKAGKVVKPKSTVTITVSASQAANQAPVAAFEGPVTVKAGQPAKFDASASTDDGTIVTYYWEFTPDGSTATGQSVTHKWSAPGTYEVTLWVTDDRGEQGSITRQVVVN